MKADFSRDTFDPTKQYSRVLMQQGRVQTDADWNEQATMFTHELRQLARELIGAHGGADDGFKVVPVAECFNFGIVFGCYFVDGIRCENARTGESSPRTFQAHENSLPYTLQPNYPGVPRLRPGMYLVYLDVWERGITHIQDPSLIDPALGGVDTSVRTKVVWQIRTIEEQRFKPIIHDNVGLEQVLGELFPPSSASLDVRLQITNRGATGDERTYRGWENGLYRVEIHEGGHISDGATFTWSRNNASLVLPIINIEGRTVTVRSPKGLTESSLRSGQWVEYQDDASVLRNESYGLYEIERILENDTLVLGMEINLNPDIEHQNPLLRVWDGPVQRTKRRTAEDNDEWIELENGIQIRFSGGTALVGDYWLFAVRPTSSDVVEWPGEQKARSICHHRAPLASIHFDDSGKIVGDITHYRRVIAQIPK